MISNHQRQIWPIKNVVSTQLYIWCSWAFSVPPVSSVFYNLSNCNDLIKAPDALDLSIQDGNHTSCLAIPDPRPSSITLRLNRQGADLIRTTIFRVVVQDIYCRPESGLMVLTATFRNRESYEPRSVCTMLQSVPGMPCTFRCCDTGQPCGTIYLTLQRHALVGAVCEIII